MKLKNAFITLILAASFILSSCSGSAAETAHSSESSELTNPAESAEETTNLMDTVPKGDYDGYQFTALNVESNYAITTFDTEALDGEIINDTIYERNRNIESRLDIIINEFTTKYDQVEKIVMAGDDAYDICFNETYLVTKLTLNGYMLNLYDIEGLNLESPWWDQNSIKSYTINNKLYTTFGNLQLHYYESVNTLMFNKLIAENYNLGNLYEYVKKGTWTIDQMTSCIKDTSLDLDGDGKMSIENDQFGIAVSVGNSLILGFWFGCGERITYSDENGIPYFKGLTETAPSVLEKIRTISLDKTLTWEKDIIPAFNDGKALFLVEVLGRVKDLRAMDTDFGILPYPKFDENQSEYLSMNSRSASTLFIPITNSDPGRTGVIIENLCALSYETLIPAYYEIMIQGKQFRDTESAEMLDIILGNLQYDLGMIYDYGRCYTTIHSLLGGKKEAGSALAAIQEKATAEIEKFTETFN